MRDVESPNLEPRTLREIQWVMRLASYIRRKLAYIGFCDSLRFVIFQPAETTHAQSSYGNHISPQPIPDYGFFKDRKVVICF